MADPETSFNSPEHARNLLDSINRDLVRIQEAYSTLDNFGNHVSSQIKQALEAQERLDHLVSYSRQSPDLDQDSIQMDVQPELLEWRKTLFNLNIQIRNRFSLDWFPSEYVAHDMSSNEARKNTNNVPNLCKNAAFERSSAFKDLVAVYDGLNIEEKMCLLCFSVFPENVIIKTRFMLYWWIGEGFLRPNPASEITAEQLGNEVFCKLMAKGFIEPVTEKRRLEVLANRCKIHPVVRAAVVTLADRMKFFDFDSKGNPTSDYSFSHRACLLAGEQFKKGNDMDKVHMVFNFDDASLAFEHPEMFSKMKNVNILCLGSWQSSPYHHIEVEDTKFLEGLKNMKHLKFLSLQGISGITTLRNYLSNLVNLTVLDLRACHNLWRVPSHIGALKNLTHLDMSECYLLVNMPKEISSLLKLQVLKGFVVGISKGKNSCTLGHLANLPKLRILSINTGRKDFPSETELKHLHTFKAIRKLTIAWGAGSRGKSGAAKLKKKGATKMRDREAKDCVPPELPPWLEKLDLLCFPQKYAPSWLTASKLNNLKKLYIRGGELSDLGQFDLLNGNCEWKVEILRLKFLIDVEMDWSEFRMLFPKLIYLEKEKCPKLTFFPCDEQGVWMKKG